MGHGCPKIVLREEDDAKVYRDKEIKALEKENRARDEVTATKKIQKILTSVLRSSRRADSRS